MKIAMNPKWFSWFTKGMGTLLVLYGGGALIAYGKFLITGDLFLTSHTNSLGILFLAIMGAFPLPIGIALLLQKQVHVLLKISAVALGINAALSLTILWVPELVNMAGTSGPVFEVFMFGLLAILAGLVAQRK